MGDSLRILRPPLLSLFLTCPPLCCSQSPTQPAVTHCICLLLLKQKVENVRVTIQAPLPHSKFPSPHRNNWSLHPKLSPTDCLLSTKG